MAVEPELPELILYHGRIVVPTTAKQEILKTLHVQHTKETKTLANAWQLYFWPGMTKDIKVMEKDDDDWEGCHGDVLIHCTFMA